MTTITALNVRLNMDASLFAEGAELARSEVNRVASIMRQSVPPAEKFKQELDLLNRAFSESGKQSQQYAHAVDALAKKHQQGQYSAEAAAKAQAEIARTAAIAAEAEKRLKNETARLAEAEKQRQTVMDKGKQLTLSVQTAQEAHTRKVREYTQLLRSGAIDQQTFNRAVQQSAASFKAPSAATGAMIGQLKRLVVAYLGVQTVAKSIRLATEVEDATVAFEVLTASAEEGQKLFRDIRDFAKASPVTFSNAQQAVRTMLSFGIAASEVTDNLKMLSDVTGGNNDRFKMLSLAFSQMSAAGRLMGQDLLQMINAGFNPLQQISKTTGESLVELKKRMEDGGISADEIRKAFADATAEGGMFHGMTERLADTVGGKLNIALSEAEQQMAKLGEKMGPMIIQALEVFQQMQPILEVVIGLIDKVVQGLGFTLAVWTDIINTVKDFDPQMTATDKFLDNLEERQRREAAAAIERVNREAKEKLKGVDEVKAAQVAADKEADAARKKAIEKTLKETDELARKAKRDAQDADRAFQRELTDARKAAMDFFAQREKEIEQRRADVAKGPGAGMEAGSAEAARFMADAANRAIAGATVQDEPAARQREIAAKTAELLIAQREANAMQARQIELAQRLLTEQQENGFARLR